MNLLKQVQSQKLKRRGPAGKTTHFTEKERIELSLAWLEKEVSPAQISMTIGSKGSYIYAFVAHGLKLAYEKGKITIP